MSPDQESPVVPSVGAVPVEVPTSDLPAMTTAYRTAVTEWIRKGNPNPALMPAEHIALRMYEAAYPLIAARVQAELEAEDECPRTTCQQIAATASDVYCEVTGGQLSYPTYDARTILSHANDQTQKLIDDECARVRAEERQRIAALIRENAGVIDSFARDGSPAGLIAYLIDEVLAAGSAVPVATPPEHDAGCERAYGPEDCTCQRRADVDFSHTATGPVATPTEPVDEVKCPDCEATIRARMSDQPAVGVDFTVTVTDRAGWTVFVGAVDVARGDEYLVIDRAKDQPATLRCVASDLTAQLPAEQDGQR